MCYSAGSAAASRQSWGTFVIDFGVFGCLQGKLLTMRLTIACSCSGKEGREGVDDVVDDVRQLHGNFPMSVSHGEAAAARRRSGCRATVDGVLEEFDGGNERLARDPSMTSTGLPSLKSIG